MNYETENLILRTEYGVIRATEAVDKAAKALNMPETGPDYLFHNILDEGPNTSELPNDDTHNAIVGAVWGLGIEAAVVLAAFVIYELVHAIARVAH